MGDEFETCAAAFFRIKGKDVVTVDEFSLFVSLSLKWMSKKESEMLMRTLISKKIIAKSNNYLKPAMDLSTIQVPIAYKPSEALKKSLAGTSAQTTSAKASENNKDLFIDLMEFAVQNGIQKGKFVSECNIIKKKLGIETCVAGLLFLKDRGIDISKFVDRACAQILGP